MTRSPERSPRWRSRSRSRSLRREAPLTRSPERSPRWRSRSRSPPRLSPSPPPRERARERASRSPQDFYREAGPPSTGRERFEFYWGTPRGATRPRSYEPEPREYRNAYADGAYADAAYDGFDDFDSERRAPRPPFDGVRDGAYRYERRDAQAYAEAYCGHCGREYEPAAGRDVKAVKAVTARRIGDGADDDDGFEYGRARLEHGRGGGYDLTGVCV